MKVKETIITIFISIFLLTLTFTGTAQQRNSNYSFFIAGHTYGKSGVNNTGLHPPFKKKFGYIKNRDEIKFGVLTGDIAGKQPTAKDWDEVDADIDSLGIPVYFAVGNHDMENRPLFENRYGITYSSFKYEKDLFIILDPNIDGWSISGEQFIFLDSVVNSNYLDSDNIFVFFHQLLWWKWNNIYSDIVPNSYFGMETPTNFWTEIEPMFNDLPNNVIMCSGDLGGTSYSSDFMYDTYDNITLISSGMGEGDGDNFIVINVDTNNNLSYDLICLNDPVLNCFGDLTDYEILSVEESVFQGFHIYPNPASSVVNIMNENLDINRIIITNLFGDQILSHSVSNQENEIHINISHLPTGMYIITFELNTYMVNQKLIVQ